MVNCGNDECDRPRATRQEVVGQVRRRSCRGLVDQAVVTRDSYCLDGSPIDYPRLESRDRSMAKAEPLQWCEANGKR